MRSSSNPVFRNLPSTQGGYAGFGSGTTQAGRQQGQPAYKLEKSYATSRPMTIDDVVTKTAMTLGLLIASGAVAALLCAQNEKLVIPLAIGGAVIGLVLVLVAVFRHKMNAPIVLAYAVAEGVFIGAISFVFGRQFGGGIVAEAVLGTVGVFAAMLVVYRTGAIRVTPKFTKMIIGGIFGVLVLMIANIVGNVVFGFDMGLRDGGPLAIGFSLLCIGLAAFSFLLDFDQADKLIRAGAPEKAAWGVALGLTVTLVWLYVEILRLLSYFR